MNFYLLILKFYIFYIDHMTKGCISNWHPCLNPASIGPVIPVKRPLPIPQPVYFFVFFPQSCHSTTLCTHVQYGRRRHPPLPPREWLAEKPPSILYNPVFYSYRRPGSGPANRSWMPCSLTDVVGLYSMDVTQHVDATSLFHRFTAGIPGLTR